MKSLPERIAQSIRQDVILGQRIEVGDRLPTIRQIQELFEVSTSTIKQAFELLAAEGLVDIRRGSGCYLLKKITPAKSSTRKKLCFHAILPKYVKYSVIPDLEAGLRASAREHDIQLNVTGIRSYAKEREAALEASDGEYDSLIVYPMPRTVKQFRQDYLKDIPERYPLVLLDTAARRQRFKQILFDNYQAGFQVTRRLIREGCRRIAFKRMKNRDREVFYRSNDDRYQGYIRALEEAGLPCLPELCWQEEFSTRTNMPSTDVANRFIDNWEDAPRSQRADAVICLEDMHAAVLITCARKRGLSIPDDLKVVGFDNNPQAVRMTGAFFPTTNPDFRHMGSLAVQVLLRAIHENMPEPETYVLPVPLKWTESE
jgi:DNA-binding LacI/PurR family transcriptional regulator